MLPGEKRWESPRDHLAHPSPPRQGEVIVAGGCPVRKDEEARKRSRAQAGPEGGEPFSQIPVQRMIAGEKGEGERAAPFHPPELFLQLRMFGAHGESPGEGPERFPAVPRHSQDHPQVEVVFRFVGLELDGSLAQLAPLRGLPAGPRQGRTVMGEVLRVDQEIAIEPPELEGLLETPERLRVILLQRLFSGEAEKIEAFHVKHAVSRGIG
jgi:hypothetical protein